MLCADLASFGYVVVSVGHPRGGKIVTYTDGQVFEEPDPVSKMKHQLDKLEPLWYEDFMETGAYLKDMNRNDPIWKDRLDHTRVGIVGNSFGGCCGIAAALKNEEVRYVVNLDGGLFVPMTYSNTNTPILILCCSWNILAYAGLSRHGCTNVEVKKYRKMVHYEFSDGVYLGPKGMDNRSWADEVSRERTERVLEFIRKW